MRSAREEDSPSNHNVLWLFSGFVALACAFSWGVWLPVILSQQGLIVSEFRPNPFGSFGPALAAVVLCAAREGRQGIRRLLGQLWRFRVGGLWYTVAVMLPPITFALAVGVHAGLAGLPAPDHLDQWYLIFPLALLIAVVGGPLGEEVGWRGLALPWLQRRFSPLWASQILAASWLLWHLPLFWLEGSAQSGGNVGLFALVVAAQSVLFAWIYNATRGSLVLVVFYHTSINTTSYALDLALPDVAGGRPFGLALTSAICVTALVVAWTTRGRLGLGPAIR